MSTAQGAARKRRSQIMLDDDLYDRLAQEAAAEGRSVSALVREAVAQWLEPRRPRTLRESPFWSLIGQGQSGQSGEEPISENVDRYLYRVDRADKSSGQESEDAA